MQRTPRQPRITPRDLRQWLARLRLLRQLPSTGVSQIDCPQAGLALQVQLQVQTTPNPNFRRVDAQVNHQGVPVLQLSTVMGRN